jgi:NAD(P)-dependent dehydrogenase (short-subunit alcohol dehydrogenase family)
MRDVHGKVAVVTGAASGIGFALAERFLAEGMKVVLADVEDAALARAAAALGAPDRTLAVRTDVSRPGDVETLAARTLAAFGAVHVVCNNAGVAGDPAPVWEQTPESFRWVMDVNFWGVVHGIRTFVPILLRQGGEGHVVNTASMAGHLSMPLLSPYHASKFAVVTISESLYHELALIGSPVKASVLCPGFVRTRIMQSERNRPTEHPVERPASEAARAFLAAYEDMVADGMPPDRVAERVVDAIRAERFWIFPHPEMLEALQARAAGIQAQANPELVIPDDMRARMKL